MQQKSKTTVKIVPALLICCLLCTTYAQSVCKCKVAGLNETTRPGANELITIIESKIRKSIFGEVNDANGQPVKDVLVEVFALSTERADNEQKKRIIACTTDEKGRFCFRKMRAGKYEVLYSLDGGWKHTSVSVVVAPRNRKSVNQELEIWLQVGT
jgi:protocatechuate 3,4-dioxygenase beta subunit